MTASFLAPVVTALGALAAVHAAPAAAKPPTTFDPVVEAQNFSITHLRKGGAGMVPESDDGYPGTYSYLGIDTSSDSATR